MATQHVNTTTFTTAQVLFQAKTGLERNTPVSIYNGHSAAIFIGDSTVTTSGATIGRTIATATTQTIYVNSGDIVYGISAAGSATGAIVLTYSA